ncbi:hypothetical protein CDAR_238621 [Caerostris darwini]|uniref:Uncharacterized protein n=1 Tax=Caerostris darwini TaxID=1538125 RepID=A0AAV4QHP9_9ARAC|nr:hypothetical protein CDAR_238621 [Caerostris darwini]
MQLFFFFFFFIFLLSFFVNKSKSCCQVVTPSLVESEGKFESVEARAKERDAIVDYLQSISSANSRWEDSDHRQSRDPVRHLFPGKEQWQLQPLPITHCAMPPPCHKQFRWSLTGTIFG